jgi:hypothetical protein
MVPIVALILFVGAAGRKTKPAPVGHGGGGLGVATGSARRRYVFVHLLMFQTGPSFVGFSFRPFMAVR